MIRRPSGASEFRATKKAWLDVVASVDEGGQIKVRRQDSVDGIEPNVFDCDGPEGLARLGSGREYESADDVRQAAVEAARDAEDH